MKKITFIAVFLITLLGYSQDPAFFPDGINAPFIDNNGYTTAEIAALTGMVDGRKVYDTDTKEWKYYNGTSWVVIGGGDNIYTTDGITPDSSTRFFDLGLNSNFYLRSNDYTNFFYLNGSNVELRNANGDIRLRTGTGGTVASNSVGDVWTATSTVGGGQWATPLLQSTVSPLSVAYYGTKLQPTGNEDGFFVNSANNNDTGFLAKTTNAEALTSVRLFNDTTGEGHFSTYGSTYFSGNAGYNFLQGNALLESYNKLFIGSTLNTGGIDFLLGNKASYAIQPMESDYDKVLRLLPNKEILTPFLTTAIIDGEATGKIPVTREWVEAQGFTGDLSNYVTLDGAQTITGTKTFNTAGGSNGINLTNSGVFNGINISNTSTGRGFTVSNTNSGFGFRASNASTGYGFYSENSGSGINFYSINNVNNGKGIVSNAISTATGNLFEGQNNGVATFSVDRTGDVVANSFTGDGSGLTSLPVPTLVSDLTNDSGFISIASVTNIDETQLDTSVNASLDLADTAIQSIGSGRTSPISYDEIYGQTQANYTTDGAPAAGQLVIITDASPADSFTGTVIPMDAYYQHDDSATDTATWTLGTQKNGALVEILINEATEPTITGATQITGTTAFVAATPMVLTVKSILGTAYYYFTEL